jgi:lipooligosaccharide transport system ATP-binding protein
MAELSAIIVLHAHMAQAPLQVVHLAKRYRAREGFLEAVADVSFEVRAGECFGLLGPNGAGKTTAIHCITGFYPPTSGRVLIEGVDVQADPRRARQALGVCAQEDTLDSDFRVLDQLVRHATYFRVPAGEAERRARALLERFGIAEKAGELVESLSGGMKRRLQVARALVADPRVLVLDEPTTGLDPGMRRSLWEILLEERARGVAILLCTHYMEEAERLCDRVALIDRGAFRDVGSPARLIERHVGTAAVEEELRPGTVWRRAPNLEDVYLRLTGARLRDGEAP